MEHLILDDFKTKMVLLTNPFQWIWFISLHNNKMKVHFIKTKPKLNSRIDSFRYPGRYPSSEWCFLFLVGRKRTWFLVQEIISLHNNFKFWWASVMEVRRLKKMSESSAQKSCLYELHVTLCKSILLKVKSTPALLTPYNTERLTYSCFQVTFSTYSLRFNRLPTVPRTYGVSNSSIWSQNVLNGSQLAKMKKSRFLTCHGQSRSSWSVNFQ